MGKLLPLLTEKEEKRREEIDEIIVAFQDKTVDGTQALTPLVALLYTMVSFSFPDDEDEWKRFKETFRDYLYLVDAGKI